MKLDRELQLLILRAAASAYPDRERSFMTGDSTPEEEVQRIGNAIYLEEHGLLDTGLKQGLSGEFMSFGMKITAAGLDFLENDGGLSAILGIVTIKIHEDTLLALIGDRIEKSDLPEPDKKKWTDALRTLSGESIKHLTMKLLDKGLENLPTALPIIEAYLKTHL